MRKGILIAIISFASINHQLLYAQIESKVDMECDSIMDNRNLKDSCYSQPFYEGGNDSLGRFFENNQRYLPLICGNRPAKAMLYVQFDIDITGSTFNPDILRIVRVDYDEFEEALKKNLTPEVWTKDIDTIYCEKEAFRLIRLLKFNPAKKNGLNICYKGWVVPISIYYTVDAGD